MFAIVGIVLVFLSIIGGFLMEKGKILVLLQPSELVIIGGAALGTLLVANPIPLVIRIFKSLAGIMSSSRYTSAFYLESLKMLSDIFVFARKSGMAKLEEDVENPEKSAVFSKYPHSGQRPPPPLLSLRHSADSRLRCGFAPRSRLAARAGH